MKVSKSLLQSATGLVANNVRTIQNAKSMPTIGCSFCGMGCSDIVGG